MTLFEDESEGRDPAPEADAVYEGPPSAPDDRSAAAIPARRYDLQILQSLRRIMRAVDIHSRRLRQTHKITAPQLVCLQAIAEQGPISLKRIAERVYLSPSTVVGVLDRLEEKGLILRARDTRDRRIVNVTATQAGRTVAGNAPSPLQYGLAAALKELSEIEQATITLSLQRVVELMEAGHIDAAPILSSDDIVADDQADGVPNTNDNKRNREDE